MALHWDDSAWAPIPGPGVPISRTPPALEVTRNAFEAGEVDTVFPLTCLAAAQTTVEGSGEHVSLNEQLAPILFDHRDVPTVPPLAPYAGLGGAWYPADNWSAWDADELVVLGSRPDTLENNLRHIDFFDPARLPASLLEAAAAGGARPRIYLRPAPGGGRGTVQIGDVTYWYRGNALVRRLCSGQIGNFCYGPSGRVLALTYADEDSLLVVEDNGATTRRFGFPHGLGVIVAVTTSGRLYFSVQDESDESIGHFCFLDPGATEPQTMPIGSGSFSSDGNYMLGMTYPSNDARHAEVWYYDVTNPRSPMLLWEKTGGDVAYTAVSQTGRFVAVQSQIGPPPWRMRTVVYRRDGREVGERAVPNGLKHGLRFLDDRFLLEGDQSTNTLPKTNLLNLYDLGKE
jgi:hypothetical protein